MQPKPSKGKQGGVLKNLCTAFLAHTVGMHEQGQEFGVCLANEVSSLLVMAMLRV